MNYMLDTDVCIYLMEQGNLSIFAKFDELENNTDFYISTMVLSELQYGISKSLKKDFNQSKLYSFLQRVKIIPYNEKCAAYYGEIRTKLKKQGSSVGNNDIHIAAHAIAENATLITNNTREFKRIDNLKVLSWQEL